MAKYLWCNKCNKYPEAIIEVYDFAEQKREYDEGIAEYKEIGSLTLGESILFCSLCKTTLVEKDEVSHVESKGEERNDADDGLPLSSVQE